LAKGGYRLDSFHQLGKAGETELMPLVAGQRRTSRSFSNC